MAVKVLLTGITGFIGGHLAQRMIEKGWEVHAVVRPSSKLSNLSEELKHDAIIHVHGKGTTLSDIVGEVRPDLVYHLASLFLSTHQYADISRLVESNVTFGTQLLEGMKIHQVHNLVNTGTSWQHYENQDYNPVNLYAASKQAFACMMKYYQETMNLNVINLQLFDTYGPGDTRRKLFALLKQIGETKERLAMSPGEQSIDIVYIDDVIEAFLLAGKYLLEGKEEYCGTYGVSSCRPLKLRDLVKEYEKVTGIPLNIEWGGRPYREREVMVPWNISKSLPGWSCKYGLEQGIKFFLMDR